MGNEAVTDPLHGDFIYGDDFDAAEIRSWYADEAEAYANLGAKDVSSYRYRYHAMNRHYGFSRLPRNRRFDHVLGFGSAYGDELMPVLDRTGRITILDPSSAFERRDVRGVPATWVKPDPSGTLEFGDATFDLVTCFGVLHHVPNVSHVLREIGRVMKPGAGMS